MKNEASEKSTKQQIIDAAFSFCDAPRLKVFSLSEVAAKVGISKPAIYRHFKNKDALIEAMEECLYDSIALHLSQIESDRLEKSKVPFARLIDFFAQNPCYVNYFIAKLSSDCDYEKKAFEALKERVPTVQEKENMLAMEDGLVYYRNSDLFCKHVFCGITIFFLVKILEKLIARGKIEKAPENFADKAVDFMLNGLHEISRPGDFLYVQNISEKRMAELDSICSIGTDYLPKEDRIFTALAKVIEEHGINGITVEKIADQLNMAKSSLYEYFDNKNQLVKKLIGKEMNLLRTIIVENSADAENFGEYIYILMRTELEYFLMRPSVIPICGWLLMTSDETAEETEGEEVADYWIEKMPERIDISGFGYPLKSKMLLGWIGCLPVGLLVQASKREFDTKKTLEYLKYLFNFVVNGIGEK
ncbi:MAG: TetR/AcrR family transcriptional regulator [Treponema sp.]|nr:TetR/AcrR family transcriptional regulator [Candidatus Treponema equifaecale]